MATRDGSARLTRLAVLALVVATISALEPTLASAGWTGAGSGISRARAQTIPTAATPTVSVAGRDVTLSWAATALSGGTPADGYVVSRYDAALVSHTVAADCAVVPTLSCVEHDVPAGTWTYSVRARRGAWSGPESARSSAAVVYEATFAITANQKVRAGTNVTGGALAGYAPYDPLTFRLDSPSGTILSASIASVGVAGSASGFTVTVPAGSGEGPHTIVAVGGSGAIGTSNAFTFDSVAPTHVLSLSSADGAHLSGGTLWFRRSGGGSFTLVDALADSGSGPASVSFPTFTANRWSTGGGTVSVPAGGPFTSATYTWNNNPATPLAQSVSGLDAAGNSASTSIAFVADDTDPVITAADVKLAPVGNTTTPGWIGQGRQYYVYAKPTDAGSGVGSVTVDVRNVTGGLSAVPMVAGTYVVGGITYGWRTAALTADNPHGTGSESIKATATDHVGNSKTSPNSSVVFENTAPSGSLTAPLAGVVGDSVVVTATAADTGGSGVAAVDLQFSPAGAGTWTSIAIDASSPYTAVWDTSGLLDGASYDVRAVITDNAGNPTVSNVRTVTLDLPEPAPFAMPEEMVVPDALPEPDLTSDSQTDTTAPQTAPDPQPAPDAPGAEPSSEVSGPETTTSPEPGAAPPEIETADVEVAGTEPAEVDTGGTDVGGPADFAEGSLKYDG